MQLRAFAIIALLPLFFSPKTNAEIAWTVRTSPVAQRLNTVLPGYGVFVAAGSGTTVLVSSDGANWTQSPMATTAPTLFSGTWGNGRYVVGGEKDAFKCFSWDAVNWGLLSTPGNERIQGLTYAYGQFVGVGIDNNASGYILTSPDGLTFTAQTVPTTNGLFAVAPAVGADGVGWADPVLVAVGERGTILTSIDGVAWIPRSSGTTVALRAIAFYGGHFLVGGDNGVMLMSSDGATWTTAAATSFDIRGLAASGTNIVAVGSYGNTGRLHVSSDGLSWPGASIEFSRILYAVAYKQGTYVAVGDAGLIVQSQSGAPRVVNSWVKPGSGDWQDQTAWSLGVPPAADQAIMITNQGWKAVAIGPAASQNFPQSLNVSSVTLGGYTDSFNVLLLNYAGFEVPLTAGSINVGTNSGITVLASALNVSTNFGTGGLTNESTVNQGESAIVTVDSLQIGTMNAAGVYNLTNGSLAAQKTVLGAVVPVPPYGGAPSPFNAGTAFNQLGGSVAFNLLRLDGGTYNLSDGTLGAGAIQLRRGAFQQASGSVTGAVGVALGTYSLSGGILRQQSLELPSFSLFTGADLNATFLQTGGTNYCDAINIWNDPGSPATPTRGSGHFVLSNGVLYVSNISRSWAGGDFQQWGGLHTNAGTVIVGESVAPFHDKNLATYALGGGTLLTPSIDVGYGTFTQSGGTNLVATDVAIGQYLGTFTLSGGVLCDSNTTVSTTGEGYPDLSAFFIQYGGTHVVTNLLSVSADTGTFAGLASYALYGGQLTVGALQLTGGGGTFTHYGGTITVEGLFTFSGGIWDERSMVQQFGQLLLSGMGGTNSVFELPTGPCRLRFADSSNLVWSSEARLVIRGWQGSPTGYGEHQVTFGSSSTALTPQQVRLIQFQNPWGNIGMFPARILSTGEIVPELGLALQRTSSGVTLSWFSGTLQSATNIAGPYQDVSSAISPYTVPLAQPQEFFRLGP